MIYSDHDIRLGLLYRGLFKVSSSKHSVLDSIQPASIDLHLGKSFALPQVDDPSQPVDIFAEGKYEFVEPIDGSFIIQPLQSVLATTEEKIHISPFLAATVEGRSSIGRKGLFIQNAGFIDPGFEGEITLELFNASQHPLILHVGMAICQMVLYELKSGCDKPYHGRYQGQEGATPSRLFLDKKGDSNNV